MVAGVGPPQDARRGVAVAAPVERVAAGVGDVLDALGGYKTYGQCETYDTSRAENLLPIGLAEGCRLKRDVAKDEVLTYADVEVPSGRVIDRLRAEQDAAFPAREGVVSAA